MGYERRPPASFSVSSSIDFAATLRRASGYVGAFLLWLCAGRHHGWPMFHARHAIAGFIHHRALFLSTLDRRVRARHETSPSNWRAGVAYKIDIVLRERVLYFVVDPD